MLAFLGCVGQQKIHRNNLTQPRLKPQNAVKPYLFCVWKENSSAHLQGNAMAKRLLQVLYRLGRFSDFAFLMFFPVNNPVKRAKNNHGENAKNIQELVK